MNILAIITARSGSKRIVNKNKKKLFGKPLILWTIEIAKSLNGICDILVSTDDIDIANISRANNLLVPWLRPKYLSGDKVNSVDVVLHALKWYEKKIKIVDGILLLQPTSPFRDIRKLNKAMELFKKNNMSSVVSVSYAKSNPEKCFILEKKQLKKLTNEKINIDNLFELNGSIFLTSTENLKKNKSFLNDNFIPLIIEEFDEGLDIDTQIDWELAEYFMKRKSL